jgi:hypothetical protein
VIAGPPVAKARPRATRRGFVYTPAHTGKYEAHGRLAAQIAMDGLWEIAIAHALVRALGEDRVKPSSMMLLQTRIFDQCTRRSPNAQRVETCCQRQRWSAGGLNVTARGGFRATRGGLKCQTGVTTA